MNPVIEEREEHLSTADFVATQRSPEQQQAAPPQHLLPDDFINDLRAKWDRVQTGFVDEPRASVKEADELVAMAIKRLAETFANERQMLEKQCDRGDNVSTEDLRIGLQKYRSFFQRLLNI